MDDMQIENTLDLVNKFTNAINEISLNKIVKTYNFLQKFNGEYDKIKLKYPYQINLFKDNDYGYNLSPDENYHNRFLGKLLSYRNINVRFKGYNNDYFILNSFLDYLKNKFNLNVPVFCENNIEITSLKGNNNIDVLIKNDKYAVIIENKINAASDQPEQLKRYVEYVSESIKRENIYIIYLTRQGGSPSNDSFPKDLKKEFYSRYFELNYKDHILEWLEGLIKIIPQNEVYLISALHQYIDYIKDLCGISKNKYMETEVKNKLIELLELNEKHPSSNIDLINKKINELDELKDYLNKLKIYEYFNKWYKDLEEEKENFKKKMNGNGNIEIWKDENDNYPQVGIKVSKENKNYLFIIEYAFKYNKLYYGAFVTNKNDNKNIDVDKFLFEIFGDKIKYDNNEKWYFWIIDNNFENIFSRYLEDLDKMLQNINKL